VPLFDTILERVPAPPGDPNAPLQMIVCNTTHDDYVGKLAVGRIVARHHRRATEVAVLGDGGDTSRAPSRCSSSSRASSARPRTDAPRGRVVAIAGIETRHHRRHHRRHGEPEALPRIVVEEPTIKMRIGVNTSPFAGKTKGASSSPAAT
jgi:GTP-binding protein